MLRVSHMSKRSSRGALVDRGANGGILGSDARVRHKHQRTVDVTGIDNHTMNALVMVDATAKVTTQKGPVILHLREYAYHGQGRTIHAAGQIEMFKNLVDDRSLKVGGKQRIKTLEGYIIPLNIFNGLPYMDMQPDTDKEFEEYPHVFLTQTGDWDPRVLDNHLTAQPDWPNKVGDLEDEPLEDCPFDERGDYKYKQVPTDPVEVVDPASPLEEIEISLREAFRAVSNLNQVYVSEEQGALLELVEEEEVTTKLEKHPVVETKKKPFNYEKYRPYFLHVPVDKVRRTFQSTTQNATNVMQGHIIQQTLKSPFPAANVWRRNEPVATDTIKAQVPAVDTNGQTMAQLFIGRKSLVADAYGMNTDAEFVNTLWDNIRKRGAMDKLISDSARSETSARVQDILRHLIIEDWQSEPHYQHQNFAELRWKHIKKNVEFLMNHRNVDPEAWLLCLQYVCDVMNHTAEKKLGHRIPMSVLLGCTRDISIFLQYLFWDIVYVHRYHDSGYSGQIGSDKSNEIRGRFVGFAWDVGNALTYKVLTDDTKKVIYRSRLRLAKDEENNLKLDLQAEDVPQREHITSKRDFEDPNVVLPTIEGFTSPFVDDDDLSPATDQGEQAQTEEQGDSVTVSSDEGETKRKSVRRDRSKAPVVETVEEDPPYETRFGRKSRPPQNFAASEAEILLEEIPVDVGYEDYSPMDDPPLADLGEPGPATQDDLDDLPSHLKDHKPGSSTEEDPLNLGDLPMRTPNPTIPGLNPEEMIDRTFLMPPAEDGSRVRAKIVERVNQLKEDAQAAHPVEMAKFKCLINDDYEEVVAYSDIVDYIEQDQTWDGVWKFREILDHQGPLNSRDKRYKGSEYNVLIEWETGETTWEPLNTEDKTGIWNSDPVSVAIYADKNDLLDTPGWKHPGLKKIAKNQKVLIRQANQAKMQSFRTKPMYMYGFQVPRNHAQAMELDQQNGNTKWRDAELKELEQIDEYEVFIDKGKGYSPGPGWKKIRVHIVYAVKHDGRHKARLVAGGHLTDTPIDSVYSSVVSLRGIRLLTFIAELNDMHCWATDIGNAYLESFTQEKVYIVAGDEFGERAGHTLIISRALYGLKSSGVRWHERLADVLREMGFFPSKAENDIWMRDKGDHYEYIAVYVDDLLLVSREPQALIDDLTTRHKFKLKGTGEIEFHLGCNFFRDKDGNLCYAPRKYIDKMMENYKRIFGQNPKPASSPLVKGDHPELDTSALLELENMAVYQSLIGSCQWAIQIGRLDICTAVMTMSRFRAAPRQGHLDRVKRIIGYLAKMRDSVIRIRTEKPDFSALPEKHYDWTHSCYPGAKEEFPANAPAPKGNPVITSTYFDANLYHDLISGRSVTGILHLLNQTPIDWYSKLQSTVETATFGSEYVAARTATEQIIDLRVTLFYLGVPVEGASMVFGDNETCINTASVPHSKLHKRHNALSYHRTREAIAAGITRLYHVAGTTNPADILSKHWDYPSVWDTLRPLLFWRGDTGDLVKSPK